MHCIYACLHITEQSLNFSFLVWNDQIIAVPTEIFWINASSHMLISHSIKPLTAEVNNVDCLTKVQCSAGNLGSWHSYGCSLSHITLPDIVSDKVNPIIATARCGSSGPPAPCRTMHPATPQGLLWNGVSHMTSDKDLKGLTRPLTSPKTIVIH